MSLPGTKIDLAHDLEKQIFPGISREKAIAAIKEYWNLKPNVEARNQLTSIQENASLVVGRCLNLNFHSDKVIERAKSDPLNWEALKEHAYSLASNGQDVPAEIATILLRPEGPPKLQGRVRGSKPSIFHRNEQLALAVRAVYRGSDGEYGRAASDNSPKNAFAVVSSATGLSFEAVRAAWRGRTMRARKRD